METGTLRAFAAALGGRGRAKIAVKISSIR